DDIKTWDLKKIVSKTIDHYLLSLRNPEALKAIPLKNYDEILVLQKGSKNYRPTLFDFLAHRAADFFMNKEAGITQPADKFEMTGPSYFASTKDFVKHAIKSSDSLSMKLHAIRILQQITAFHENDANPDALIDVELKRLKFVRQNAITDDNDSLYLAALYRLNREFSHHPLVTEVKYEIALELSSRAGKYSPLVSDEYKWENVNALKMINESKLAFPDAEGTKKCLYLKHQIEEKSLSLNVEYANIPDKPFKMLLKYKNQNDVKVRIINMDPEKDREYRNEYNQKIIDRYKNQPIVKEFSVTLPNDSDYQNHSVEIKMPELPLGYYVVLVSSSSDFNYVETPVAYGGFWVSKLSFTNRRTNENGMEFNIFERDNGNPIPNAKVETYIETYDYVTRKYYFKLWKTFYSDMDGFIAVPPVTDDTWSKSFYISIQNKKDLLYSDNYFYISKYYPPDLKPKTTTYFFTDRAIYRPGQTIYFKGIMLEKEGENTKILPNHKSTVTFYDVNYQKIADQELTSNEFGSFSGTFTAPTGVLNGQMRITDTFGAIYISVEEYKRPKFEVTFNPLKGSYKLDQKVSIIGKAVAYAGNSIDNAKVKYRVVRTARFPYWGYWWGSTSPSSPQMEITNGFTTTNEKGEFTIDFLAQSDKKIKKKAFPIFNYTVYADVTDMNGETHSANKSVEVAYTSLLLNADIDAMVDKAKTNGFEFGSTNLNYEKEPCKGSVNIYKINQPDKVYRNRNWARPDKFVMTKEQHNNQFPDDVYDDEDNMYSWAKGDIKFTQQFNTKVDSVLNPSISDWEPGVYVMEMKAKDAFNEEVTLIKYFTLFAKDANTIPESTTLWYHPIKKKAEPGEKVSFLIGTRANNVKVLFEIEHKYKIVYKEWITLNNQQRLIEIPVKEEDRGNFSIHITTIKNSRAYTYNEVFEVPYTNKKLDISFETFRNKLVPGQEEEWKVKIMGKQGDKVAAEMLATLYDASLDAFKPNNWYFNLWDSYYSSLSWSTNESFDLGYNSTQYNPRAYKYYPKYQYYDQLNLWGLYLVGNYNYRGAMRSFKGESEEGYDGTPHNDAYDTVVDEFTTTAAVKKDSDKTKTKFAEKAQTGKNGGTYAWSGFAGGELAEDAGVSLSDKEEDNKESAAPVQIRSNFAETAFFYPQLQTDSGGNVYIKFTIPEALTRWKMMGMSYTKDLKVGSIQKELVTQKDLMVFPNAPRFFRIGDTMTFITKISNVSDKDITDGTVTIEFSDASTSQPINIFLNNNTPKSFNCKAGMSDIASWDIVIPDNIGALTYKVVAKAGSFSDGEENTLPVLSNRMLVTESLPLWINGKQTKSFTFDKLINANQSSTLKHHKLTLEFSSNPAWYAIQALPYLIEYPYECAEQTFSRYYANNIASYIANSNPKIKKVFDSWKNFTPDALLSNLEKNQDLKIVMLEETPWVLDAKNETERKHRIALLFDLNKMSNELSSAINKLLKMQTSNGGWPWWEGMPDSRYITQHIITGMGHLGHLGVKNVHENTRIWSAVAKGVNYLDNRIREDYEWIKKYYPKDMAKNHLGNDQIQYLYARSYFKDIAVAAQNKEAFNYFLNQANTYWLDFNLYMQGMISLALNRYDYKNTPQQIILSLKEKSLSNEELGMYWRDLEAGYYWYQAPIETQSLLIEAFDEVGKDLTSVEKMKVWLLKQKQTQDWKTTKATVEACYALLLRGTDVLANDKLVDIKLGNTTIEPSKIDNLKVEAGTGYFKTSWNANEIKPEMGNVTLTKTDDGIAWGALYWQYFEQLDKITPHQTPLKLEKKLFREYNTPTGPVIEPITATTKINLGDKIKVRIELRVDREMEYVHMKDMRAAGFEPVNVISMYKYQDGLGYYQSTRDAATHFFFESVPKGTYVFEYMLLANQSGMYSNSITSIECMYAPEFGAHSEGIRVKIEK
ncbi:MAG: alpha-2-macroglobulin family protein, partial [Bacteroidota bacterium]